MIMVAKHGVSLGIHIQVKSCRKCVITHTGGKKKNESILFVDESRVCRIK